MAVNALLPDQAGMHGGVMALDGQRCDAQKCVMKRVSAPDCIPSTWPNKVS